MWHFIETATIGVEALSILVMAVRRIVLQDLVSFMVLYFWQMVTSFVVLYVLYPRAGEHTLRLFDFNNRWNAAISLAELSLTGDSLYIDEGQLVLGVWQEMPPLQSFAVGLFEVASPEGGAPLVALALGGLPGGLAALASRRVRPVLHEQLDDVLVAGAGSHHERGATVLVDGVDRGATLVDEH